MKRISVLIILSLLLLTANNTFAQTRQRSTRRGGRTTSAQKSRNANSGSESDDAKYLGAARVAEQIKNLTRFIYLLGGAAKDIAALDEAVKHGDASPAVVQQAQKNKATVRSSLSNVREGLDSLEIYFRTTPGLEQYYTKLAGVAQGAATAEDLASQNQLDRSGRSLLDVINRLTDVLLAMR